MPRIIGAGGLDIMMTYVDASYEIHDDMKGHTGGIITMGKGIIQGKATKQKLNTKSSTEAELVGASDYIPWTVWAKWFLGDQGYKLKRNIFFQDNESAMKLESNGKKSAGDKSRHISIRYFFITDVLKRENIELRHYRTERMIADYYTKPLQGSLFRKMRDILMGLIPFPDKERVEYSKIVSKVTSEKINSNKNEPVTEQKKTKSGTYAPVTEQKTKSGTYADAVRTEGKVRRNKNSEPASQAIGQPASLELLTKLIKFN